MTEKTDAIGVFNQHMLTRSLTGTESFLRGTIASGVLLLLASAVEHVFFGPGYYSSLVQHPFWIIVLLASMQSGLYVGVATAGMAAFLMDWPPRPVGMDITEHYIDVAILPLQWLLAALCIGLFRQSDIRAADALEREQFRLKEVNEALAEEIVRADAARDQAELQAATRPLDHGIPTDVLRSLLELQDTPPDALVERFKDLAPQISELPADLLLTDEMGRLDRRSGDPIVVGFALPAGSDADPVEAVLASCLPTALRSELFGFPGSFLAVAGIAGDDGHAPAGVVVFVAERLEDAEALCPLAGIVARSVECALIRAGRTDRLAARWVAREPATVRKGRRFGN